MYLYGKRWCGICRDVHCLRYLNLPPTSKHAVGWSLGCTTKVLRTIYFDRRLAGTRHGASVVSCSAPRVRRVDFPRRCFAYCTNSELCNCSDWGCCAKDATAPERISTEGARAHNLERTAASFSYAYVSFFVYFASDLAFQATERYCLSPRALDCAAATCRRFIAISRASTHKVLLGLER